MISGTRNASLRRNILLIGAAVSLGASIIAGLRPWQAFASPPTLAMMAAVIASGFFAALGIREFAGLLFDLKDSPWYAQPWALFFLLAMLVAIHFICRLALRVVPQIRGLPCEALLLAGLASQLAWVAALDWPCSPRHGQAIEEAGYPDSATYEARRPPASSGYPSSQRPGGRQPDIDGRNGRLTR